MNEHLRIERPEFPAEPRLPPSTHLMNSVFATPDLALIKNNPATILALKSIIGTAWIFRL